MKIATIRGVDLVLRPLTLLFFLFAAIAGSLQRVLLTYAALAMHEAAHVLAARLLCLNVHSIELAPYGGIANIDDAFEVMPEKEIMVALAGPACSFLLCVLSMGLEALFPLEEEALQIFVRSSFVLGSFNLLPAMPLDGGRILRSTLSHFCSPRLATKIAAYAGIFMGLGLLGLGIASLVFARPNASMLLAGICIAASALRALRQAEHMVLRTLEKGLEEVGTAPVAVRRIAVDAQANAVHVLSTLRGGKYTEVLVLGQKQQVLGLVGQYSLYRAVASGAVTMGQVLEKSRQE